MSHLVKGITSDHQLIELAKQIGVHLDGIYELSEIRKELPNKGSYLILLRRKGGDVGHWTAKDGDSYFDSEGVGPPTVLGNLKYNNKQYQSTYGEYCGIWSLFYRYCRQKDRMDLFKQFDDLDTFDVI